MRSIKKTAGKASFVVVAGLASLLLVIGLFVFSGASPTAAAADFMSALARGDADKLTELSMLNDETPEQIHKQWEDTVSASKHYLFLWKIQGSSKEQDSAVVRLAVQRNVASGSPYDENFQLRLIKKDGKWKVDLSDISREMYPNLPR